MSTKPSVKNIKVVSLAPEVKDPEIKKLLPTVVYPEDVSMELHDVNVAVANGLRRVVLSEIPVYALTFDYGDFRTNNPHTLNDYTRDRIKNIPVMQNVNPKSIFRLNVMNTNEAPMRVKSHEIEMVGKGKLPFNETFDLAMLNPGRFLSIDKIYIQRGYGYTHGGFAVASGVTCIPIDQQPYDVNTLEGVQSGVSDPRVHRLAFTLNGTISHGEVMRLACDEMIRRLDYASKAVTSVYNSEDTYHLVLPNETHTIGNILVKGICEQYPDVPAVTYSSDPLAKTITLSLRTQDDIETLIVDVCKHNMKTIGDIKSYFK